MKKIFTLLTAILLCSGMMVQAQWQIARNGTCTSAEIVQTNTSKRFNVKLYGSNNYGGNFSNKSIFVVLGIDMDYVDGIRGTHSFTSPTTGCGSGDNFFINQFNSSKNWEYIDNPWGNITFTYSSMGNDGYPRYRIQITAYGYCQYSGLGCINLENYDNPCVLDVTVPVYAYTPGKASALTLTDYYTISVSSSNTTYGTVSGAGTYANGASQTLIASVMNSTLYEFKGWKKNGSSSYVSTSASYTVTVNAADSYVAEFAPKAATQYTINAESNNTTYGTVTGHGSYYENNTAELSANSADALNYYFQEWQNKATSAQISTSNPYSFTVNATTSAITYKAIFAPRDVVNITASDDMVLIKAGSFWSVAGAGTDNTNNYTMQVRFDAISLTGTFNSGVNTSETWVQKEGGSKIYAQSISVATVTEPTTGVLQIVATVIGTDQKKYVITGYYETPKTGAFATFSWDDPNDDIYMGTHGDGDSYCTSQFAPYGKMFVEIIAVNATKNTNNLVKIYIQTTNTSTYSGITCAAAGTYPMADGLGLTPNSSCNGNSYWYWTLDQTNVAIPYQNDTYDLGVCALSTYGRNYVGGSESGSYTTFNSKSVRVSAGKDGKPYVEVFDPSNGNLHVVIGAPKASRKVTIANPGSGKTITVTDGVTNYATGTEHRIPEGTVLTITVSTTDNTRVTGWTGTNSSDVTGSGNSYSLTVGEKNYNIAATFESNTYTLAWNANNGEITAAGTAAGSYTAGVSISAPTVARTGYTPNGWLPEFTGTMPSANTEYVAQWNAVTYNLTYNGLEGATNTNPTSYTIETETFALANPGARTGYTFSNWTCGGNPITQIVLGSTGDKTITANWTANTYTVTFNANGGSGDAMDAQAFTYGVAQNLSANTYTAPENKHFIGWATTAEGDVEYAAGANVSNLTATKDGSVELFAKWAYNTYTVVFNKNNESAIGSMADQAFTYGTAQNLTTNGFTLSGHDFAGWATEENGAVVYTNGEEVNNLTSVHEGTVNLYAKWIEIFVLRDDKEAGDTYYTTTYANKKAEGKKLNVQYNRSFTAGRWATFALPFGYSFRNRENPTFGGQVYYLISAKYEQRGEDVYLTLNCMPNTTGIEANKPYVLIPNGNITNPVFEDVKLKDIAENPYTASDMSGTGTIMFVNTTYRQRIDRADADENLRVIFLKNNTLCYPGGAVNMSAFRGYFYMMDDYMLLHGNQNAPVRVRLMTPDGEYIEQAPDTDQPAAVETKKYIENGILVIERAGMKYDAQGHIIK